MFGVSNELDSFHCDRLFRHRYAFTLSLSDPFLRQSHFPGSHLIGCRWCTVCIATLSRDPVGGSRIDFVGRYTGQNVYLYIC
jgi:hypothetical protein